MSLELICAYILCGLLTLTVLPLAARLLRATDQRRQEQERDRVIDAEQRRMKARYGK